MKGAQPAGPAGATAAAPRNQLDVFEGNFDTDASHWDFHDTTEPATRYARDRRLRVAVDRLQHVTGGDLSTWSALVTCAGVGGEGSYLANRGVGRVTVSDFSPRALSHCRRRDARLETLQLDAEQLDVPDESFDLVLVQDGLHHLPRPVLGFTEMLRVARRAVVVIEPHAGLVARCLGREWERHGDVANYVFRWDRRLLEQSVRSYLLERPCAVEDLRFWDYTVLLFRLNDRLGSLSAAWRIQKLVYRTLNAWGPLRALGNMMVAVIVKDPIPERHDRPRRALFE